ncbi:hypothetical protein ACOMHN_025303 [Nucella lapillus]
MATQKEVETPVLHVIVVGFHHKKGCQVEYSYPPVIVGNAVDSHELPGEWKHLPSLALPDGAHNYQNDTVFFHLPSRDSSKKTVYCVSCYRQMDAKDLLNRTADITRSTVQKSVCVLSRLPLYGLLKAKLELITHAYFDERDFSKVELLEQTFNNLNASLTQSLLNGTQVFLSLSPREAVARFKHKLMVLFKLLLLERRVLFFGSPVELLGSTLLSVLSLYPGMLEFGLAQAVSDGTQRLVSPTLGVATLDLGEGGTGEEFVEVHYHRSPDEEERAGVRSELSELLPFMHNSPLASEPPESPTIPRGGDAFSAQGSADASDSWETAKKDREQASGLSRSSSANGDHVTATSSAHGGSGLEVHKPNHPHPHHPHPPVSNTQSAQLHSHHPPPPSSAHRGKGEELGWTGGEGVTPSPMAADLAASPHSPLEDLSSVTHISAVQTGSTLPNFIHRLDSISETAHGKGELTLPTENSPEDFLAQAESVEDLDSPESLSKIDREDCFSWEEDRLHLSLAVDEEEDGSAADSPLTPASSHHSEDASPEEPPADSRPESQASDRAPHSSDHPHKSGESASPSKSKSGKKSGRLGSPAKSGSPGRKATALKNKLSTAFGKVKAKGKDSAEMEMTPVMKGEVSLQQDDFGFPMAIFTKGSVCHPYLSLQFHHVLHDVNVRSFVLGATNILFRQQKQASDVIVEVEEGKLEIKDRELQKQVNLTTADLRFSELLVRQITEDRANVYLDGTEWEGSDEWVRAQFRSYLQSLLATVQTDDARLLEDFGPSFIAAWKTTHNFRHWVLTLPHPKMAAVPAGHPFQGNLSVTDVRMRLNHSMQSTERGRKINAAVVQTGKYVMQTGKVVGGAFSSARSAVSSWFTSITNDWRNDDDHDNDNIDHTLAAGEEAEEGKEEDKEDDREDGKEDGKEDGRKEGKEKEEGKG